MLHPACVTRLRAPPGRHPPAAASPPPPPRHPSHPRPSAAACRPPAWTPPPPRPWQPQSPPQCPAYVQAGVRAGGRARGAWAQAQQQHFPHQTPQPLGGRSRTLAPKYPRWSAMRWRLLHCGHSTITTPVSYACLLNARAARVSHTLHVKSMTSSRCAKSTCPGGSAGRGRCAASLRHLCCCCSPCCCCCCCLPLVLVVVLSSSARPLRVEGGGARWFRSFLRLAAQPNPAHPPTCHCCCSRRGAARRVRARTTPCLGARVLCSGGHFVASHNKLRSRGCGWEGVGATYNRLGARGDGTC